MSASAFQVPLGRMVETALERLVEVCSDTTRAFADVVETGILLVQDALLFPPPWALILLLMLCAWRLGKTRGAPWFSLASLAALLAGYFRPETAAALFRAAPDLPVWVLAPCLCVFVVCALRREGILFFTLAGFCLIWSMGFWEAAMSTLSLVLVATALAMLLGIPLGILAGISRTLERCLTPVLDIMQTMPSFVYLIPAIPLFGLGKVAAVFATLVFALPPAIRMTCLGIRQVPPELAECADAFGATRVQRLVKLELPLAVSTILAGINQTVMLALSMVVVAAMIGAGGLGGEVWKAIQRLDVGLGFEAGIGIVIIAIFLDRLLQQAGKRASRTSGT